MIIDFSYTSQNSQNEIEYYNVRGQIVKTYQLSQLELWVLEQDLLNTGEIEEIAECDNPFSKHYKLMDHPIYDDLDTYIMRAYFEIKKPITAPSFSIHR